MSFDRLFESDATMSEAAEESEPRDNRRGDSLDDSSAKLMWEMFRAVEHEVVHADGLCSTCSATVSENRQLVGLQSRPISYFSQDFADIVHQSTYCWFCRFLCRVVARTCHRKHFTRCLKENMALEVSIGFLESRLLLSVNDPAPTVSYNIEIDTKNAEIESGAFSHLWYDGVMTCHSLVTPPSITFRKVLSDTVEQKKPLFNEISRWLSVCESRHPKCSQRASAFPSYHDGFRLIDVRNRTLCRPTDKCSYVALSYVWGKEPFSEICESDRGPVLLSDLIKDINRNLRLPQYLPQTIEDAITVTENLGQQYLWVDLICIDQFDPPQKRRAIMTMDKIYVGAILTICVIDGSDMFSGIPGIDVPLWARIQVIADTNETRYMFTRFQSTNEVLEDSDWATRAWTFQEGEVSTRRLCFAEEGVFLICREEIFHDLLECDQSEERVKCNFDTGGIHYLALGFDLDMQRWNFDTYARMVASYSHRLMTYPSDAYDAMAGAIHRMSQNLNTTFIAALPAHDLPNALLWLHHDNSFINGYTEGSRRLGFSTWSWLGWEGTIEYWFWLQKSSDPSLVSECIFSLVNRHENVLYHDAVKINASAYTAFEFRAHDTHNAILKLTTTIARFRVSYFELPQNKWSAEHRWLLLDRYNQRVDRGDTYHQDANYYGPDCELFRSICSIRLHSNTSDELTKANVKEVEFVLLQHWSSTPSRHAPEHFCDSYLPEDKTPEHNRQFEDTIWTMAIRRTPSGLGERLNLVSIPAKAWFAAEPQPAVVHIA